MSPMRDGRNGTSEDRATQLLICEKLSLAIWMTINNSINSIKIHDICMFSGHFHHHIHQNFHIRHHFHVPLNLPLIKWLKVILL